MVDVRNLLERAAPDAAPVDIEAIRHGAAQRRRRRHRLAASGLVLVLLIVGTATWVSIRDGDQPAESQVATTPETDPTEQAASSDPVRLSVEGNFVTAAEGRLWTIAREVVDGRTQTRLFEVDASSGSPREVVVLERSATWIGASGGLVWVGLNADGAEPIGYVAVVDPERRQVVAVHEEGGYDIAFAAGYAWVSAPTTDEVLRLGLGPAGALDIERVEVGRQPSNLVATGDGAIWVTESLAGTIARIDTNTLDVVERVSWDGAVLAASSRGAWAWRASRPDELVNIDPSDPSSPYETVTVTGTPGAVEDVGGLWVSASAGVSYWRPTAQRSGQPDARVETRDVYSLAPAPTQGAAFYVAGGGGGGLWRWAPTAARGSGPAPSSTTVPACRLTLQSTAVPAGWDEETFPGDGGEAGDPAAIAHWRAGRGHYVNILEPDNGHLPVPASGAEGGGDTQRVDVLGVTAEVRAIHEGYGVAVALPADPPCGFALVGYGITQSQLADLTEGLYTTSAAGRPSFDTLGAFWPEGAAADVPDIQTLTNEQGWRLSAEETALRYGRDLFRSRDVALAPDGGEPSEDGRNGVVLGVRSGDQTAIVKLTRAVGHRWFSVYEAIVPFRPTTPTRPEEPGCPVLVDAGGRRWTTAAAETLPDGVLQDGDARLALTGRSTAELRLRDRQYRLVVPSDDSGDRCGV